MDKSNVITYLKGLRNQIIAEFETLDTKKFERTNWDHHTGGGGEISLLRGETFEKAAVNFSAVEGPSLPFGDEPFFATGVSLITHMMNPYVPTVHMNVRYIETKSTYWFGGGYDLTPMGFPFEEDRTHFHHEAQNAIPEHYEAFAKEAAEYFYIKHRKKERGMGGIFFDKYKTGNKESDFQLMQRVGNSFLPAIMPIYHKRKDIPYSVDDKLVQNELRAHYVEFNLIYDRGTKFGFVSGGNPDAILCSMPPTATW